MARFSHPAVFDGGLDALVVPHGQFESLTTQQAVTPNVVQAVMFEQTVLSQGVTVQQDDNGYYTKLVVESPGVYNIMFSGQIHHLGGGGGGEIFTMWFRKNGVNVPNSRTVWHVPNGKYAVPTLNIFLTVDNFGDYFQLVGYPDNTAIVLEHIPANGSTPASPSIIITVNQVA
jgi:hypothetical protein